MALAVGCDDSRAPGRIFGRTIGDALALYFAAFSWGRHTVRAGSGDDDLEILRSFARWLAKSEGEAQLKGWVHLVTERACKKGAKRLAAFFVLFDSFFA